MYQSKSVTTALELVNSLGLPIPQELTEESKEITFPANLGDLNEDELAQQLTGWTELKAKAAFHEAIALTNKVGLELALHEHEAQKFLELSEEFGETKSNILKARIATDPRTKDLKLRLHQRTAEYDIISAIKYGFEEKYAAVSRELTRKGLCK